MIVKSMVALFFISLSFSINAAYRTAEPQQVFKKLESPSSAIVTQAEKIFTDLSTQVEFDLFDFKNKSSFSFSPKYKFNIDKALEGGYYTRTDLWRLKTKVDGGVILDHINTPYSFGLSKKAQAKFIRQFATKEEAWRARPYTLLNIPTNAEKALSLNYGDYISVPSTMNLFMGLSAEYNPGLLDFGIFDLIILRGSFTINFLKLEGSKIRLKIFAGNGWGNTFGAYTEAVFKVFGINILDSFVTSLIDWDLLEAYNDQSAADYLVFDYIFDLSSAEARDAFNSIATPSMLLNDAKLLKDVFDDNHPELQAFSDLEKVEKIVNQDKYLETKRIEKVYEAYNDMKVHNKVFSIDLFFFNFDKKHTTIKNKLTLIKDDNKSYYYSPSFIKSQNIKLNLGFKYMHEKWRYSLFTIYDTNPEFSEVSFSDFGHIYKELDHNFSTNEQKRLIRYLRLNIPDDIFEQVDWKDWSFNNPQELSSKDITTYNIEFFVNKTGVNTIAQYSFDEIYEKISTLKYSEIFKKYKDEQRKEKEVKKLAETIYLSFSPQSPLDSYGKSEKFLKLKKKKYFRNFASAILKTLLTEQEYLLSVYYKFIISAENAQNVSFMFGENDIYQSKLYYQDLESILEY